MFIVPEEMGGTNENAPAVEAATTAEAGGVEVTSVETAQLVTDSIELTVSVTQISNVSCPTHYFTSTLGNI